jgi:succinate dehydrogenase (ubiquinone) iron-sulfur subunit
MFRRSMATTIEHTKGEPISTAAEAMTASRPPVPETKTTTVKEPSLDPEALTKTFHVYRWNPDAVLHPRPEQDRTYDVGRAHQDQERDGPDPYFQAKLQRGHLR